MVSKKKTTRKPTRVPETVEPTFEPIVAAELEYKPVAVVEPTPPPPTDSELLADAPAIPEILKPEDAVAFTDKYARWKRRVAAR